MKSSNNSALAFGRRTALVALLSMALAGGAGASLAWADTTSPAQDTPVLISADQPEGSNAEKTTAEGLVYTIGEAGAEVTGYTGSSASVAIPYDIEGAPVVTVNLNNAGIAVLDLSRCSALQELSCSGNKLASLDLSACPQLKKLTCRDNAIATLDLSGCSKLTYLLCANNALTKLDLTAFPNLYFLNCYDNKIATLKIAGLAKFQWFNCGNNKLKGTLDLSSSTELRMVTASENKLTTIKTASSSELIYLDVSNNMLSSVNLKRLPGIRLLNCERNQLTKLDASANKDLASIYCRYNKLTTVKLDSKANMALKKGVFVIGKASANSFSKAERTRLCVNYSARIYPLDDSFYAYE